MSEQYSNAPMLEMYIYETTQMLEQLETTIMQCEREGSFSESAIAEIFRCMHTIKGSSAMMLFNDVANLAHSMEDVFYFLRENKLDHVDCSLLSDLIFEGIDFIKAELEKINSAEPVDGDATIIIEKNKEYLLFLKADAPNAVETTKTDTNIRQQYYIAPDVSQKKKQSEMSNRYKAIIVFDDGCGMENIRAFSVVHSLKDFAQELYYIPEDIIENEQSADVIKEKGFYIYVETEAEQKELEKILNETLFMKELSIERIEDEGEWYHFSTPKQTNEGTAVKIPEQAATPTSQQMAVTQNSKVQVSGKGQGMISVSVEKLDSLMDIVGEMVIAEAMVTQNPELKNLDLDQFHTAARQLHKITIELQDMVMSIRMVPLSATFMKMQRILRDMSKKLQKEVELKVIGEETEVDKNIIEQIGDPLMHLIRNAIDHGIEGNDEREALGKPRVGTITIEAKNSGSDVLIIIKDDGKGLNKQKIYEKARKNGIADKDMEEMTDREVFSLILKAGFSMKENVTEFSGRGVGMDVVTKNLESVGGSIHIESVEGQGSSFIMKIPLTLAIIDGMNCKVGNASYTIPIMNIKESFRPKVDDYIKDPDGREIIMVRGYCYPIVRLHQYFNVETKVTELTDGILVMVEQDEKTICLFLDELLAQQQVVVKALPNYIKKTRNVEGIAGCTLLGDGSISLIIDIAGLHNRSKSTKHEIA
ncbi:chemotaxis protein CheA [Desulfuribacillus alkaliarsenatis]|uniref:Chemotaxis protein CheA n=1 Tax=Desulfuribacillus alkaliarsenatis TaxID=766136 RepID=A0A1E5G231_9FIRM|nr:chemotaxis protein CheA [Desulfuribacillus alkaliarsenatis]OEF96589.1 chemotaxis protein CheA [Desulfuribacillus alkaliarsenatis]